MPRRKVVLVEGIIGAGKSVLTEELGRALGKSTLTLMEPDEKDGANPYLQDFYKDAERWALIMQVHLLQARFRMHQQAQWHAMNNYGHAVLDRSFQGDTCFARMLHRSGVMSQREFDTYKSIYHAMTASVLLPNVCVRLVVAPRVAQGRIKRRMEEQTGRECEDVIDLQYLTDLDTEISHMTDVLRGMGVSVIELPWDDHREKSADRAAVIERLAAQIVENGPVDLFLDTHRRSI
jgi:deoxyadenosine/deoxycytidine kinase